MPALPARRSDLIIEKTETGLLVRDPVTLAFHQLSSLTAATFEACDGQTAVADVITRVKARHSTADDKLVWSALDELGSANLLSVRAAPLAGPAVNRRSMLRTLFTAGAAGTALGVAPGLLPAAHAALEQDEKRQSEARQKLRAASEEQKKALRVDRQDEQACKSKVEVQRDQTEVHIKDANPAYRKQEATRKQTTRQSERDQKKMRTSVGLESADGDWRVPVALDGEKGLSIEGQVDLYSFSIDGDGQGGCGGSMTVLFRNGDSKAMEQTAKKSEQLVRSAESVTISFNDEPGLEAKLARASGGFTEFDEKGLPISGAYTYTFWIV